jgi:hypothetical protein
VTGTALGFAAGATIAALRGAGEDIAARFVLAWLLTLFALLLVRSVCRSFTAKTPSQDTLPVVILGTSTCAHSLYLALAKRERAKGKAEPGVRIAAIFAEGAEEWPEIKGRDIVVGAPQWARNVAPSRMESWRFRPNAIWRLKNCLGNLSKSSGIYL